MGGIQEIDTALILAWGPQDRLELTAVNSGDDDAEDLLSSIQTSGQQVPVLLRPADNRDGKFEVIYGRRRILACQKLGIPVRALIRTLDDNEALIAKGLENASRQNLSFYERARFAQAILDQGHTREEAQQALSISKNTLSQLERVSRLIPDAAGVAIGAAHGAGRPKWMALAAAFEAGILSQDKLLTILADVPDGAGSDARLQAALDGLSKRGAKEVRATERSTVSGAVVKSTRSSVSLTVKRAGDSREFAEWLDDNIDRLIKESYQSFKSETGR
ncbi:MAG: plasmid partitioning protein RepB [Sulfitobacter sp.]